MPHAFDIGYDDPVIAKLVSEYPGPEVYPPASFRSEWGPIFHRGRLDGSARVLVIGQDPGQHESYVRRILVGEAGQRAQGFLAKLGIERSYVMVNCFLYSVYTKDAGKKYALDANVAAYRDRWFSTILAKKKIEAVVALGGNADSAWLAFTKTTAGQNAKAAQIAYAHITHPTAPESGGKTAAERAKLTEGLLANWNGALQKLSPVVTADTPRPLVLYGKTWQPGDLVEVPEGDLPAGLPAWMRGLDGWAARGPGDTPKTKRATLTVVVPSSELP